MKILLTGGTGFLGKHVIQAFQDQGCAVFSDFGGHQLAAKSSSMGQIGVWAVDSWDGDLTSDFSTKKVVNDFLPDVIVHLAAKCGGIIANSNNPVDFLRDNTLMALNIYEAAQLYKVQRVYALGTVCMYPRDCPVPFREDDIWNGEPEKTNFPYSQAKRTLLMLSRTYRQQYGIGGAFLVPVNMFGTQDHFDLTNSHVIPALIRKFITAKDQNLPSVECWGSGYVSREFLFAPDCATAIVQSVLSSFDYPEPINLGTGKEIIIKDLAQLIAELVGYQGKITFNGQYSGQPRRCLDVSRAKELLNWEAKTDLRTGLLQTIDWYRAHQSEM